MPSFPRDQSILPSGSTRASCGLAATLYATAIVMGFPFWPTDNIGPIMVISHLADGRQNSRELHELRVRNSSVVIRRSATLSGDGSRCLFTQTRRRFRRHLQIAAPEVRRKS